MSPQVQGRARADTPGTPFTSRDVVAPSAVFSVSAESRRGRTKITVASRRLDVAARRRCAGSAGDKDKTLSVEELRRRNAATKAAQPHGSAAPELTWKGR